jgi:hypothetical protein
MENIRTLFILTPFLTELFYGKFTVDGSMEKWDLGVPADLKTIAVEWDTTGYN